MTDSPSQLPPPGWYPDPADPAGRRYWDGRRWTEHTLASAWGQPASDSGPAEPVTVPDAGSAGPVADEAPAPESDEASTPESGEVPAPAADQVPAPAAGPEPAPPVPQPAGWGEPGSNAAAPVGAAPAPYPGYEAYLPHTQPLTASGMRRVSALFTDMGRILKRAWWQITVLSLVVWIAWSVLAWAAASIVLDFGRLTDAVNLTAAAANDYPNGRYPSEVTEAIRQAFEAVPRTSSAWTWALVGGVIVLLYGLATCLQVVSVNRLGMDAAAGRGVRLGSAVRSGLAGGLRLFGYYVLFTLVILAALLVVLLLMAATSSIPPLLVLIVMLATVGAIVASVFLLGRLAPITAQVAVGRGALGWTWRATRTRFWGVLGRYLLWALVASIIGQIVLSLLTIPLFLATSASMARAPLEITPIVLFAWMTTMVLSLVLAAITYLGVVPIWRDLTDDPDYRSIADGQPLPDPA